MQLPLKLCVAFNLPIVAFTLSIDQNNIVIALQAVNKTTNIFNQVDKQMNKLSKSFGNFNSKVNDVFGKFISWKVLQQSFRVACDFIRETTQEFANLADSADMASISSAANLDSLHRMPGFLGVMACVETNADTRIWFVWKGTRINSNKHECLRGG